MEAGGIEPASETEKPDAMSDPELSPDLERSWNANIRPQRHLTGSPELYAAILAARRFTPQALR